MNHKVITTKLKKKLLSAAIAFGLIVSCVGGMPVMDAMAEPEQVAVVESSADIGPEVDVESPSRVYFEDWALTDVKPEVEELPLTRKDIELIALCVMAEAEGESELGKRLVIDTILNRMDSNRFPDTVRGVIYQPHQFSGMYGSRIKKCYVKEDICELVEEELRCRTNSEVVYFRTGHYHKRFGTPVLREGNHYFSSL